MAIYQLGEDAPRIADTAWVADSAEVIGRVSLAEESSIWYGCVLRGDNEWLEIGARIGRNCLVGAGTLVPEGKEFPDGVLIVGTPAKVVRELAPEQIARLNEAAERYVANARRHREGLKKLR
jgi:carbonic anhydrase/acetyltransferase-like protein (isoleucine patch superfamily)